MFSIVLRFKACNIGSNVTYSLCFKTKAQLWFKKFPKLMVNIGPIGYCTGRLSTSSCGTNQQKKEFIKKENKKYQRRLYQSPKASGTPSTRSQGIVSAALVPLPLPTQLTSSYSNSVWSFSFLIRAVPLCMQGDQRERDLYVGDNMEILIYFHKKKVARSKLTFPSKFSNTMNTNALLHQMLL